MGLHLNIHYLNKLKIIKSEIIAIASEKIKATIIAKSMREEAEGFLPTAFTAAYPTNPTTTAGPTVLNNIITTMIRLRILF
jgi:hypothetical protein